MELLVDAILIILLALAIDRFIGELPNSIHPLRWMGNILAAIDSRIGNRASRGTSVLGLLSYILVFAIFAGISLAITSFMRVGIGGAMGEALWIALTAILFKISFAIFSFRKHCDPICADLDDGKVEDAASKVQMIVSRNTEGMDAEHIASSCCETVSENLVDSAYSPMLYFGLLGLPGAVMFRCTNLMDAMWGYLNDRYARLGYFPAKFDDVLGFVTSRMSPAFIALAGRLLGMDWRAAVPAARAEHTKTPSPNSGWSMTACSAVLGIRMEKAGVYVMGEGPMPTTEDVRRCCRLVELASVIFLVTISLILYCLVGIRVQMLVEDSLFGFWEGLLRSSGA